MATNEEAARLFYEIADLLDILGERFKPEAYRRAARAIEGLGEDLATVAARGGLDEIPGVGEAISEKIREYLRDGRIPYRDRLSAEIPSGLLDLLAVPGLGPKTVRRFWVELGILGPAELSAALEAGRLDGVKGFGPTKIRQLRDAVRSATPAERIGLWEATRFADALVAGLKAAAPVDRIEVAGSFRRARETVGDLDLLVNSPDPERVFDAFGKLPEVASVRLRGGTKETVLLRSGLQVDLRIVPPESFGAALQYFTGSKDHNVRLRTRARDLGLKVNEYGVYKGEERVAGDTEASVYRALGLPEIPPELREDRGEIDAAEAGRLPNLVPRTAILGELHVHLPNGPDAEAIAPAIGSARSAGLRYLGLVLPARTAAGEVAGWRQVLSTAPAGLELGLGREGTVAELSEDPSAAGFDYEMLRADGDLPPTGSGPPGPVLAVTHLGAPSGGPVEGGAGRLAAWTRWAAAHSTALEIVAAGGRGALDSGGARAALEAGVRLLVSGGDGFEFVPRRLDVALAIARRGGATVDRVVTAGAPPWSRATGPRSSRGRPSTRTAP